MPRWTSWRRSGSLDSKWAEISALSWLKKKRKELPGEGATAPLFIRVNLSLIRRFRMKIMFQKLAVTLRGEQIRTLTLSPSGDPGFGETWRWPGGMPPSRSIDRQRRRHAVGRNYLGGTEGAEEIGDALPEGVRRHFPDENNSARGRVMCGYCCNVNNLNSTFHPVKRRTGYARECCADRSANT